MVGKNQPRMNYAAVLFPSGKTAPDIASQHKQREDYFALFVLV
jgi:hypothetical protein